MHTLEQLRSGELDGTSHLQLSADLQTFPAEIYALADSLEVLDLSNNRLSDLPDDLHRFSKLRVLFASNNQFRHVPDSIGRCDGLTMIGFKHNHIEMVSQSCLPASTRWLILTDNCIRQLPANFGDLLHMEKLALAGNHLTALPDSMRQMQKLALLRIAANQLVGFPDVLLELPALAWLAFSGNPFCPPRQVHQDFCRVPSAALQLHEVLGRGASGVISRASWSDGQTPFFADKELAIKVFHGDVTTDGYPQDELDACLTAAAHPNLVTPLARVEQSGCEALLMQRIPPHYRNLGQPPSLASCTRDTFTQGQQFSRLQVDHMVRQMSSIVEHLEAVEVCHGDLYAHNVLIAPDGHLLLGDFGAASRYSNLSGTQKQGIRLMERRSLAHFIDDLEGLVQSEDTREVSAAGEYF